MPWRDLVVSRLQEIQPASVCALDAASYQLSRQALPDTPLKAHDAPPDSLCALALGVEVLEGLEAQQASQMINHTRVYVAPSMLLVAHSRCALDDTGLRALGFTLTDKDPLDEVCIYYYDIATYKAVPDWLNDRFWAHPERWKP